MTVRAFDTGCCVNCGALACGCTKDERQSKEVGPCVACESPDRFCHECNHPDWLMFTPIYKEPKKESEYGFGYMQNRGAS